MFCEECKALLEQLELAGRKLTAAAIRNLHAIHLDASDRQQHLADALEINEAARIAFQAHQQRCVGVRVVGMN